jgi:putative nucleotidyltransferase with HDIG domain
MPFSPRKHRRLLVRAAWVLAAAAAITALMPKQVRFPYAFELGQPWTHENLLAPFDFGIAKSETELAAERAAIRKAFVPYYERQPGVRDRVLAAFRRDLAFRLPDLVADSTLGWRAADSARLVRSAVRVLDAVYARGVVRLDSAHAGFGPGRELYVVAGNRAERTRLEALAREGDPLPVGTLLADQPSPERAFLQRVLPPLVLPDVRYKPHTSAEALAEELALVSPRRGKVGKGEKIIFTGEIVTEDRHRVLSSLRDEFERYTAGTDAAALWVGYGLLVGLTLTLFSLFLLKYRADVFRHQRSLVFVLLLIIAFVALTVFVRGQGWPVVYLVPFGIAPIILRTFFGTRAALFTLLVILLLSALLVDQPGLFLFLHLTAGLTAIFANLRAQYWSQFFVAMAWLLATYAAAWTGFALVEQGSFARLDPLPYGWLALNVFFCLMGYPLILVFERLFGVVSDITLRELADLNKPLLRELSLKAPGTMQHSVQVGNLAEAAVSEIGGNALLARVGALYHDVGKMVAPTSFIENQQGGHNPHDDWSPERSAMTILEHVPSGLRMARKHNLPESVADFIRTHHGTTRVEYFWRQWQDADPGRSGADDEAFRYPGPLPATRETAVVLLADTVEAATRSLNQPTAEQLDAMVDRLVQHKVDEQQLIHADLTFRELTQIKKVFKKLLRSIHHVRVPYPGEDRRPAAARSADQGQAPPPAP